MKIAICFKGELRTGVEAVDNIKSFIGDLWPNCDFFIHTWDDSFHRTLSQQKIEDLNKFNTKIWENHDEKIKKFIEIYNPKLWKVENFQSLFKSIMDRYGNMHKKYLNQFFIPRFYSWREVIKLKQQYEIDNNFVYDYVVSIRPDCIYSNEVKLMDFLKKVPDDGFGINGVFGINNDVVDDLVFISLSKVTDIVSTWQEHRYYHAQVEDYLYNSEWDKLHAPFFYFIKNKGFQVINLGLRDFSENIAILRKECLHYDSITEFHKCRACDKLNYHSVDDKDEHLNLLSEDELIRDGKLMLALRNYLPPIYNHLKDKIMINLVNRDTDIISEKNDLESLKVFKKFPVFMGCVTTSINKDIFVDMNIHISKSSGMIQINPLPPLELIYQNDHGSGTIGKLWNQHHTSFANFVGQFKPKSVFEIGGGTGILSVKYNAIENINWLILDINPNPTQDCVAEFIKGKFDENFRLDRDIDAVVHSHVLEHIFYPNKFLQNVSNFIQTEKKMFFSVPDLSKTFQNFYLNCLNFEHSILLTEEYIDFLLLKNKFKILQKEYFLNGHSIFYAVEKDFNIKEQQLEPNLYQTNKKLFFDFIDYYEKNINLINQQLDSRTEKVYLFGGHINSQFLINLGLNIEKIKSILDNDVNKQGKRLYGTSLCVESPKVLLDKLNPVVILNNIGYNEEIRNDILKNINPTTLFLEL